ncbi:aminotransferase class IV family protein [Sulfuricurvum sp.]|uniref:aminotransferase class IV family protein n=1 Tax=Sulfuricurvum sp. TaxID=2025608 RepID=UPI002635D4BC|nr:aminotransferase class IV family protein [Sulfuricurvum sp.]MDD2780815.1 aminotransferase class IV family protein [Sulfuricurvum sp.]
MLLETIRCIDGEAQHLSFHQIRLERTLYSLGVEKYYDLASLITPPDNALYRCRFLYNADTFFLEFLPYLPKKIDSLKRVYVDNVDYSLKYANRECLNTLYEQRGRCDDVLIIKNGFLTDTTISNIALFIEGKWLTPDKPLLMGTTRARLIDQGLVFPAPLHEKDLERASNIAIMNAMMGFIEVENGIIT